MNDANVLDFIGKAINQHVSSEEYKTAQQADEYDRQKNTTIYNYVRMIFTSTGVPVEDFTAANNKIASNFFHRLNTQRCMYSLGNGISFSDHKDKRKVNGVEQTVDLTDEMLGTEFDTDLKDGAYKALIHGVVPLWDEETGALRAGIRFWQLDKDKPITAVLYEEDGYTKFRGGRHSGNMNFAVVQPKTAYKQVYRESAADGVEVVGAENYGSLPIVPLWGSKLHQSTLVGMQRAIDSYDLIRSGFANDLTDCAQIYWILSNCSGMTDPELARFRDRLKVQHIAVADTENSGVTPYTQEIPFQARQTYLDAIRAGIYEDFGGLDVHTIAAGATNDHIDAAYQPLDENADDFEYQIIKFVQQILALMGVEDTPVFKMEAQYLDDETVLQKLPNITVDEIPGILQRKGLENQDRFDLDIPDDEKDENEETQEETP